MAQSAPRYDRRIRDALRALDDRREPMAEICRRVAAVAEAMGLPRPSYVHMRRLLVAERERQDEERARRAAIREIATDVVSDLLVGKRVVAYEVADRVREAGARRGE